MSELPGTGLPTPGSGGLGLPQPGTLPPPPPPPPRSSGRCTCCLVLLALGLIPAGILVGQFAKAWSATTPSERNAYQIARDLARAATTDDPQRREEALRGALDGVVAEGQRQASSPQAKDAFEALRGLAEQGGQAAQGIVNVDPSQLEPAADLPPPGEAAADVAKVGQWVILQRRLPVPKDAPPGAEPRVTYEHRWVAKVGDDFVTIASAPVEVLEDGTTRRTAQALELIVPNAPAARLPAATPRETISVAGTRLTCPRLEQPSRDGGQERVYLNSQLPVFHGLYGYVRRVVLNADGSERETWEVRALGTE